MMKTVNVRLRVSPGIIQTNLECTCPAIPGHMRQIAYKNSLYPHNELPGYDYLSKKALIINPIYIKQKIRTRHKNVIVLNFEGVIGDY
jgi:hypothetical protein